MTAAGECASKKADLMILDSFDEYTNVLKKIAPQNEITWINTDFAGSDPRNTSSWSAPQVYDFEFHPSAEDKYYPRDFPAFANRQNPKPVIDFYHKEDNYFGYICERNSTCFSCESKRSSYTD